MEQEWNGIPQQTLVRVVQFIWQICFDECLAVNGAHIVILVTDLPTMQ